MSDNTRKDLPAPGAPNYAQRVRETLMTYMGRQGNKLDRGLTLRDLLASGLVKFPSGFNPDNIGTGSPPLLPGPGATPAYEADLTPPPMPTGFYVSAAISNIFIGHDAPGFTAGHGYLRTQVYGATWVSGPLPVFSDAVRITSFTGTIFAHPTNPATTWRLWITWESNDGVASLPAGGTNGLQAITGQNVAQLLQALSGQITASQLYTDLGSRIDLIDGPGTLAGSVAQRLLNEADARGTAISAEQTIRADADASMAQQISRLTAGVSGGFDPGVAWYFDATAEGWTSAGASTSWASGWLNVTSTGGSPILLSPAISILGAQYSLIRLRVKRLAGAGWNGSAYHTTPGHGFGESYKKTIANAVPNVGDTAVLDWDMSALTVGGQDWVNSTITAIRLNLGATSADVFSLDWVAVGRSAPGASMAGLLEEKQVRADADSAEATLRIALASQVNNATTGLPATRATLLNDYYTKVGADSAIATNATYLRAYANLTSTAFRQATAPTQRGTDPQTAAAVPLRTGDTWIDTDDNKLYQWSGSAWVYSPDGAIATVDARVTSVETTKIGYCSIGGAASDHTTKTTCETAGGVWNVGLPLATAVKQVYISDGVTSGTIEQKATALKTSTGALELQWAVKTDLAGLISGYGLASTVKNAAPSSAFGIQASQFYVAPPATARSTAPTLNLYNGFVWLDTSVTPNVTRYYTGGTAARSNLCLNANFTNDLSDWTFPTTTSTITSGRNLSGYVAGNGTAWIRDGGTGAPTGYVEASPTADIAVVAGRNYEWSIYTAAHRCKVEAFIYWINSSNNVIGNTALGINDEEALGGTRLSAYKQTGASGIAPAGATKARCILRKSGTKTVPVTFPVTPPNTDSFAFFTRAYFSEAQPMSGGTWSTTSPDLPFVIQTTPTTINGKEVPAGVYLDAGFFKNATITSAMIGELNADDITAGTMTASRISGGSIAVGATISSTADYAPNVKMWSIDGAGNATFNNAVVRGTVYATAGQIGGITVSSNSVRSTNYDGVGLGFALNANGTLELPGGSVTSKMLNIGLAANVLNNAGFASGTYGWWQGENGVTVTSRGLDIPDWFPSGGHALYISQPNTTGTGDANYSQYMVSPPSPVVANQRYEFSVYTGAHRCNVDCFIHFYNASGGLIATYFASEANNQEASGGQQLSGYKRLFGFGVAPAAAASTVIVIRKSATLPGYTNSFLFATQPMVAMASPYQTLPSAWSLGGSGTKISGDGIEVGTITADLIASKSATSFEQPYTFIENTAWHSIELYMDRYGYVGVIFDCHFNFNPHTGGSFGLYLGVSLTYGHVDVSNSGSYAADGPQFGVLQSGRFLGPGFFKIWMRADITSGTSHYATITVLKSYR
ncbi:hypothetical protein [Polaromonas sp. CG9_12]|nr:hypothetical protein [Polaromonas sp. CG9_12]